MKFQKLGNTDIDVSVVALGTWGLGGGSVWTDGDSTVEDAKRLLDICHEHGVNYIDTAPVYGTGVSEELLGKALKGRRNDFVLQTKCSLNWRNEGGNFHYERDGYTVNNDTRASAVKKDVEDSLRRMGTDYLDSVIVHYVCGSFPVEETVGALENLVREGKIRTYGLSNSQPADLAAYQEAGGNVSVVQCIGAGRKDEAVYYIKKLCMIAEVILIISCLSVFVLTKPITILGGMEKESADMCIHMTMWITIVKPLVWIMAFIPGYGMRAAGDVKFSMLTSCTTMWLCRFCLSVFMIRVVGVGAMGVWIGMFSDWTLRGIIFSWRFHSRKWLKHQVI